MIFSKREREEKNNNKNIPENRSCQASRPHPVRRGIIKLIKTQKNKSGVEDQGIGRTTIVIYTLQAKNKLSKK